MGDDGSKPRWLRLIAGVVLISLAAGLGVLVGRFRHEQPAFKMRHAEVGMTEEDVRDIWGSPVRTTVIGGNDVWYYDEQERMGITFKDGKCTQSNLVYYVAPDGTRHATDQ